MKITDYSTRTAPMDYYIAQLSAATGKSLTGIEIGVDVGAHAESLLTHCRIDMLYLVDIWDKEYYRGYCQGRLETKGFISKIEMIKADSISAAARFGFSEFDFMYFDQKHDYETVINDLKTWWPKLKKGGILGYRNYAASNVELTRALDEFIANTPMSDRKDIQSEIVLFK